jgi:uncharacterized protein DUF1801
VHFLNEDGMVACNPRDREAAHRAEVEGIATEHAAAVTCRKCRMILWSAGEQRPQPGRRAKNKTKPTDASVEDYVSSKANEQQRTDCRELMALLEKITQLPPKMWGPSIVGYGSYRYTYESGRTGEAPLAGFAIRGRELVVYLLAEDDRQKALLAKLGKHKMGKSCLYFKQLADVDKSVLERLAAGSVAEVRRRHG